MLLSPHLQSAQNRPEARSSWDQEMSALELRIVAAHRELKLARKDGAADWMAKAIRHLDELLDQLPREGQQPWIAVIAKPVSSTESSSY